MTTTERALGIEPAPQIERALETDRSAIERLLTDAGLPLDGLEAALPTAVIARAEDGIAGCAAVETYGSTGLLRSVCVAPSFRGGGLGRKLVAAAERLAEEMGASEIYLLTESAAAWFPLLGYAAATRASVPATLAASPEFASACPQSAVLLHKLLHPTA